MGMGLGQGESQHRACTFPLELPVTMRPPRRSNEATMFNSGWGRRKKKRIIHMSPVNTYRNEHIIMYESIRVIPIGTCSLRSRLGILFELWASAKQITKLEQVLTWALNVPCYFYLATHTTPGPGLFPDVGPRLPHTYTYLSISWEGEMLILVSLSLHQHWHILHRTDKEDVTVEGGTETVTFKLSCSNYTERNFTYWP